MSVFFSFSIAFFCPSSCVFLSMFFCHRVSVFLSSVFQRFCHCVVVFLSLSFRARVIASSRVSVITSSRFFCHHVSRVSVVASTRVFVIVSSCLRHCVFVFPSLCLRVSVILSPCFRHCVSVFPSLCLCFCHSVFPRNANLSPDSVRRPVRISPWQL